MSNKQKTSFTLSLQTVKELELLVKALGENKSAVIARAIAELIRRLRCKT